MKGDSDHTRSGLVVVLINATPASTAAVACRDAALLARERPREASGAADSVGQGGENQGATGRNDFFSTLRYLDPSHPTQNAA